MSPWRWLYTLLFIVSPFAAHADDVPLPTWKRIAPSLEISEVGVEGNEIFTPELALIRTDLKSFRVSVLRAIDFGLKRTDAKTICRLSKGSLCINGNFFDEDGRALGLVISRGILHQKIHRGGSLLNGIFQVTRQGPSIVDRTEFDPSAVVEAIQAGPHLIKDGRSLGDMKDSTSRSRRSGVCIDSLGRLIIFCSSSSLGGISIERLQHVLLSQGIACQNALNFDGGGSAQLFLAQSSATHSSEATGAKVESDITHYDLPGRDDVPVFLSLLKSS